MLLLKEKRKGNILLQYSQFSQKEIEKISPHLESDFSLVTIFYFFKNYF
jgi:hypothetical protein